MRESVLRGLLTLAAVNIACAAAASAATLKTIREVQVGCATTEILPEYEKIYRKDKQAAQEFLLEFMHTRTCDIIQPGQVQVEGTYPTTGKAEQKCVRPKGWVACWWVFEDAVR